MACKRLIYSSSSPAGTGFFLSSKTGPLNTAINSITASLPSPSGKIALYSVPDIKNANHLVQIQSGNEWRMVFNMPIGYYEYLVISFGLMNAPFVFKVFEQGSSNHSPLGPRTAGFPSSLYLGVR